MDDDERNGQRSRDQTEQDVAELGESTDPDRPDHESDAADDESIDLVAEEGFASFPASDPPSTWAGGAGGRESR